MSGTGSWGKELGGGSIDIDFNLSERKLGGACGSLVWRWRLDVVRESGF